MKQYDEENTPPAKEPYENGTPWERELWYEHLGFDPVRFQSRKAMGEAMDGKEKKTLPQSDGASVRRIFALGFFDGVHLGHQALLTEAVRLARDGDLEAAAITFEQHPQALFTEEPPALINTVADRVRLLRQYGIGTVCKLPVTREVMSTPWRDFLQELTEYGAAGFVCGHDFRFGHRGVGNARRLKAFCHERGLPCVIVPEQTVDGVRVSSTCIRGLLEQGEMVRAVQLLGHPHILTGTVVPGRKLGRTIGIPTANLALPREVAVPKFGVYACKAAVDGKSYLAVTNVGTRPTVAGHHVTVEPWILDFEGDLYGKEITLEFYEFLRPERRFNSLEELRQEIHKNAEQTRNLLQNR